MSLHAWPLKTHNFSSQVLLPLRVKPSFEQAAEQEPEWEAKQIPEKANPFAAEITIELEDMANPDTEGQVGIIVFDNHEAPLVASNKKPQSRKESAEQENCIQFQALSFSEKFSSKPLKSGFWVGGFLIFCMIQGTKYLGTPNITLWYLILSRIVMLLLTRPSHYG